MKKLYLAFTIFFALSTTVSAQDDRNFSGTKWVLTNVENSKKLDIDNKTENLPFIIFSEDDGEAKGFSGCKEFTVSFYLSGDILKFDTPSETTDDCKNNELQKLLFATLENSDAYLIIGSKLSILQSGNEIATFEAAE